MKLSVRRKRIVLIACAVLLIVIIIALIIAMPLLQMRPAKTGRIDGTGVIAVNNGMCSVFLIESSEGYILIDAGSNPGRLEKSLDDLGVSLSDIKNVFLTHSDGDHVAALPLFPGAVVYMSEDEVQMTDGRTKRNSGSSNSLPDKDEPYVITPLINDARLTIGGREIRCVKAPGHTPGTMVYIVDDSYVFTGDAFLIRTNRVGVHPFTMDKETSEMTIKSLITDIRETQLTFTAHYGYHDSPDLHE